MFAAAAAFVKNGGNSLKFYQTVLTYILKFCQLFGAKKPGNYFIY